MALATLKFRQRNITLHFPSTTKIFSIKISTFICGWNFPFPVHFLFIFAVCPSASLPLHFPIKFNCLTIHPPIAFSQKFVQFLNIISLEGPIKMNSRLVPVNASTSANATSIAGAGGNHRQKLDQIRSSLRPFEQKWYEEVEEDDEGTLDDEEEDEEEEEEDKDGKKAEMIRALVEAGYDQESAFYALKLVNFRSVMAAIQVLTSIKKNIVQQHTKNNNINNNGRPSSGIPLFNSPPLPPNPNKFVAVNGAATSSSAWPSEPLSQVKSFPMEQQKSPLSFGKQQQFRPVHRAPTMISPPPPRNVGGPSPGHALRQSQSFGPADLLLQQQQAKSSMGIFS